MLQYTITNIMIADDNQKHLDRFKTVPPHPSYIAGFIDGDGCIFIRKITDGYQTGFTITQCRTNILQIIRYHFGGSITTSLTRKLKSLNIMEDYHFYKYNIRNQYNLVIRNNEYQLLLDYLYSSFIIKEKQYQCLYKFNKVANLQNKNEEKEDLHLLCSTLNKKHELDTSYISRLNIEYIAGLFDAEGCFYINKINFNKFYISLTQANNPKILHEIVKYLRVGMIDNECKLKIYKISDCLKFIRLIKDHLIVKYNQAIAFETYLQSSENSVREKMYDICNKEKHELEEFAELNQNEIGKDGYFESIKIRELKKLIYKEIHNKTMNRNRSEKMKGIRNHNFGKTFSDETRQKMSLSIRNIKGGVSDEVIQNVRELIKAGHKNVEIQHLLHLPRHTVTRIKNGDLICRTEEKKENKHRTSLEVTLSKRKIATNEIIIVIEKLLQKWKPNQILNYLIEQRNINNIPNELTINIIKNIKTKLKNGQPIIYDCELSSDSYLSYLHLVNSYSADTK